MKERDMKKIINEIFESSTPDLSSDIISSCEKEAQLAEDCSEISARQLFGSRNSHGTWLHRLAPVAACLLIFVLGFSIGSLLPGTSSETPYEPIAETVIYLDVNPSIELQIDSNNKIIDYSAGNYDAEIILSNVDLKNMDLNTALSTIVYSMHSNGYLSDNSNSLLLSVASSSGDKINNLLSDVSSKIDSIFKQAELQCSILAQGFELNEELKARAEENGVSAGKIHLVDKMTDGFKNLPQEFIDSLLQLSISELNLIYIQGNQNENSPYDEIVMGEVSVNITSEKAKSIVLNELGKSTEDAEYVQASVKIQNGEKSKIVYSIKVKLLNDDTIYRYEVDCQTCEVVRLQ